VDAFAISLAVAACVFAGAIVGLSLNKWLPAEHVSKETQDVIRLGTGMISVLASLVLGLLVATTKSSFDQTDTEVKGAAVQIIMLDRALRDYGSQSADARSLLHRFTQREIQEVWPADVQGNAPKIDDRAAGVLIERTKETIRALSPASAGQTELRADALRMIEAVIQTRWLLIEQAGSSVRPLFLIVLIAWVVLIFTSFGFNAPRNATVMTAFFICAVAIGGAIFLILEMDTPFSGLITISSQPMDHALAYLSR
jgi:hypothetical protein